MDSDHLTVKTDKHTASMSTKIGIVGSGLIGQSWAMIFASVGYQVGTISSNSRNMAFSNFLSTVEVKVDLV